MLCQNCGKKPATVHYTEIVQGQKNEYHLCETCAREKGEAAYQSLADAFSVPQLLSGLLHFDPSVMPRTDTPAPQCPRCGMTFNQFAQIGRFGCPACYETFAERLEPLLRRIQSSDRHSGKVPKRRGGTIGLRRELEDLRGQLQASIAQERFEDAARLRDRIRQLEQQLKAGT